MYQPKQTEYPVDSTTIWAVPHEALYIKAQQRVCAGSVITTMSHSTAAFSSHDVTCNLSELMH